MRIWIMIGLMALVAGGCAIRPDKSRTAAPVGSSYAVEPYASAPQTRARSASLWSAAPGSLMSMRRAKEVGDILTVVVNMQDQASVQSSLNRSRTSNENLGVNALLGLPEWANGVLPGGANVSPAIDFGGQSTLNGNGSVNRAENVTFRLAARVVGVEPNGNLVIQGYQQVQVSQETRYLAVTGVIRTQDITRDNTVEYDQIAEAKLSYVSSGVATAPIEKRAAPKLLERIVPF